MTTELHLIAETQADSAAQLKTYRRADEVLAELGDRIPERLHETTRGVLVHFAAKESKGHVVRLALPGEAAPRARSELELLTAMLAELPIIEFADADSESIEIHMAAEKEIFAAKAKGETLSYLGALRIAETKMSDR